MDGDDEVTRLRRRVSELQARLVALEGAEKKRLQVENCAKARSSTGP